MFRFIFILVWFWLLITVAFYFTQAYAHSWYSFYCCSDNDCTKISDKTVTITKKGYEVRLTPKDHPSIKTPFSYFVPYGEAKISEDSDYHACIIPGDPEHMRCLYTPNMGF